ncbi:hypothetical protein HGB47_13605 [Leptospira yasudae]|nr:hypothetical protein [Leptospira yasudae]MBW0434652.1 hypothetical protein [Leptospira yasudae]
MSSYKFLKSMDLLEVEFCMSSHTAEVSLLKRIHSLILKKENPAVDRVFL